MLTPTPRDPKQKTQGTQTLNLKPSILGLQDPTPKVKEKGFIEKTSDFLGFTPLAKYTAGKLFTLTPEAKQLEQAKQQSINIKDNLVNEINRRKRLGQDTSRLEQALKLQEQNVNRVSVVQKSLVTGGGVTGRQALGSALNVAATAIPFGRFLGGSSKALGQVGRQTTGQLIRKTAILGAKEGAIGGAVSGLGFGLMDKDASAGEVLGSTLGGAVGGTIIGATVGPLFVAGARGIQKGTNIIRGKEKILDPNALMTRTFRISKAKQQKFEQMAGETVGTYLNKRGLQLPENELVQELALRATASRTEADKGFEYIDSVVPRKYKFGGVEDMLNELVEREARVSSPNVKSRDFAEAMRLKQAYDKGGLNMTEINRVKRLYERNVKLDYLRSNLGDSIQRANNIDSNVREWQFKTADKLGFKNLRQINKETQLANELGTALYKEMVGKEGNNALSLTDAILLSGGDPTSVTMMLTRKVAKWDKLRVLLARKIADKPVIGIPKAILKTPELQKALPAPEAGALRSSALNQTPITALGREGEFVGEGLATPFTPAKTGTQQLLQPELQKISQPDITPTASSKSIDITKNKNAGFISNGKTAVSPLFGATGATLAGAVVAGRVQSSKANQNQSNQSNQSDESTSKADTSSNSSIKIPSKNIEIKKSEIPELKAVLYGEVSNRDIGKKELEIRVILNTVINRIKEYKKNGKEFNLTDVISMPNQYQAYKGEQYTKYKSGKLDELGKRKKQEVDAIVDKLIKEIESGNYKDITNNAFFYVHNKDGSITYDDKRPLFKK